MLCMRIALGKIGGQKPQASACGVCFSLWLDARHRASNRRERLFDDVSWALALRRVRARVVRLKNRGLIRGTRVVRLHPGFDCVIYGFLDGLLKRVGLQAV